MKAKTITIRQKLSRLRKENRKLKLNFEIINDQLKATKSEDEYAKFMNDALERYHQKLFEKMLKTDKLKRS